jgi:hypothetical protein
MRWTAGKVGACLYGTAVAIVAGDAVEDRLFRWAGYTAIGASVAAADFDGDLFLTDSREGGKAGCSETWPWGGERWGVPFGCRGEHLRGISPFLSLSSSAADRLPRYRSAVPCTRASTPPSFR